MAVIFQTKFSNPFSCMKVLYTVIQILPKCVPKGEINNTYALFQIMAWFTAAYMHHTLSMS